MNKSIHQSIKIVITAISLINAFASTNSYAAAELEKNNNELLLALVQQKYIQTKDISAMEQLLQNDANPNAVDNNGNSVLSLAIKNPQFSEYDGFSRGISLLLTYKADVNPQKDIPPLKEAIECCCSISIIKNLLKAGADTHSTQIASYIHKKARYTPNECDLDPHQPDFRAEYQARLAKYIIQQKKKKRLPEVHYLTRDNLRAMFIDFLILASL